MPKYEVLYRATIESLIEVEAEDAVSARKLVMQPGTDAGKVRIANTLSDHVVAAELIEEK